MNVVQFFLTEIIGVLQSSAFPSSWNCFPPRYPGCCCCYSLLFFSIPPGLIFCSLPGLPFLCSSYARSSVVPCPSYDSFLSKLVQTFCPILYVYINECQLIISISYLHAQLLTYMFKCLPNIFVKFRIFQIKCAVFIFCICFLFYQRLHVWTSFTHKPTP